MKYTRSLSADFLIFLLIYFGYNFYAITYCKNTRGVSSYCLATELTANQNARR